MNSHRFALGTCRIANMSGRICNTLLNCPLPRRWLSCSNTCLWSLLGLSQPLLSGTSQRAMPTQRYVLVLLLLRVRLLPVVVAAAEEVLLLAWRVL